MQTVQVPDGQGAYRQVVRYYHVGPGQGDFEPVPETNGPGIMGMLPVAILFLVLILAVTLLHISANFRCIARKILAKSSSHKSTAYYTSVQDAPDFHGSFEPHCYSFRFLRCT